LVRRSAVLLFLRSALVSVAVATVAASAAARQIGPGTLPKKEITGIVTIGDGVASHGLLNANDFVFAGQPDPAKAIEQALLRTTRIVLLRGDYAFVRPLISSKSEFAIDADPGANLRIAHPGPVGLFQFSGDGVRLAGIDLTITVAVADQTAIEFSGKNSTVERGRFEVTVPCDPVHPVTLVRYTGAVRKVISNCLFLPNTGVTCVRSVDGNGLSFLGNEISNGVDGGFPEGFTTRNCYRGIDLEREEWATISSSKFFGLGTPTTGRVDALIRYQGDGVTEAGHIIISGNHVEAIASDRVFWLRACQWFNIVGNVLGPSISFPDALGEAVIVVVGENGADGGQHSGPGLIVANDIHNSAFEDSDATAIYLEGADCITIDSNTFEFQRAKHVIHIDASSCREAAVRGNRFMGWQGLGAAPISPIRVTNEACDALVIGSNDFRGFSGGIMTGNPTGPKLFLRGLIDLSDRAPPDAQTKIQDLSTNVDFGNP
jgi:hypothetical protein